MITKDTDMTTILNSIANYPKKFHNTVVSPTKICIQFSHVESKLRLKAGGYYIKLPDGYKGLPITPEGVDIDQLAVGCQMPIIEDLQMALIDAYTKYAKLYTHRYKQVYNKEFIDFLQQAKDAIDDCIEVCIFEGIK